MSTPADFRSKVISRRDACVQFNDKQAKDRKEALRFYRGDNLSEYGDSNDGLSTVVSRDTMEAIESMMPSLVKSFVAGDEVVRFEPVGPEDEEGAAQATDYVNFVFTTHNNAFRVVYDAMKDGLLYRLGIAKTVLEEVEGEPERYEGLSELELQAIQSMGREIIGDVLQDEVGFTVTLKGATKKHYRVHVIAPDEFLYEERLPGLGEATFLAHRKRMTLNDLIEMGIDEATAKSLSSGRPDDQEQDDRFPDEDEAEYKSDDLSRPVWVDECYIRCVYEEVYGWRKVLLGGAGSKVLSNEEADDHPYSVWTPIPTPHKLAGLSIHDLTRDIQLNKTAVQRELNNAMYLANRPMREAVHGNMVNADDLLNPTVGGVVWTKQIGSVANIPSGGDAAFGASFQAIEYYDSVREARTGVTRYNQGMDTDSLNKTATGMSIIATASQQRQELVARQFAEFMKDIFRKILRLVSQHGEKGEVIRLRGQWVEVDPTDWKTGYDMSVQVGLGTNNKQQLVGNLMQLIELDKGIIQMQGGVQGPLVTAANVYEKLKRLGEAMDLKGIEKYYTDPAEAQQAPEPEGEQQDPLGEAKIKAQADIGKAEIKANADIERESIKAAADLEAEAMKQNPLGLVA